MVLLLNSALRLRMLCAILPCFQENRFKLAQVQRRVMWRTGETENLLWKQIVELHVMKAQGVALVSQKYLLHVTASGKITLK